jgi:hypothetical protein
VSKLLMSRHRRGTDATKCGLDVLALHRRDHVRGRRIVGGQSVGIANLATCQQPLRSRGFVAISVDDADKRSRRLRLTPAGRALLVAALPVWESEHAATEALLTGVDPDRLRGNLRMLY